jgi:hypothetical protein
MMRGCPYRQRIASLLNSGKGRHMRPCTTLIGGVLIAAFIGLFGCATFRDRPLGSRNQIVVIADESVWQAVADPLSRAYEREIRTPQPEKTYYLDHVQYAQLSDITRRPYILFVAPLKSPGPTSVFLSNALSPEATDGVNSGEYYVFEKPDLWARDQLVLFVTAPTLVNLIDRINEHANELYSLINDDRNQIVQSEMYSRLEQTDLEKKFRLKYGWQLRIQHDYVPIIDDSSRNLVMLKRSYPDRWLSIHWLDGDHDYLSLKEVAAVRDTLGKWFPDPVFEYPDYYQYHAVDFRGRAAGLLTGLWATNSDIGGGPFFTYAIYDSVLQRSFFLDGAVFAPQDDKEPYVRQLQIMARTFIPGKRE